STLFTIVRGTANHHTDGISLRKVLETDAFGMPLLATGDAARQGSNWWSYRGNDAINPVNRDGLNRAVIVLLPARSEYQTGLQNLLRQILRHLRANGARDDDIGGGSRFSRARTEPEVMN
ncbi:MAG: hypothetical protein C4320_01220, partial [Armatimonadota bacterium]